MLGSNRVHQGWRSVQRGIVISREMLIVMAFLLLVKNCWSSSNYNFFKCLLLFIAIPAAGNPENAQNGFVNQGSFVPVQVPSGQPALPAVAPTAQVPQDVQPTGR